MESKCTMFSTSIVEAERSLLPISAPMPKPSGGPWT